MKVIVEIQKYSSSKLHTVNMDFQILELERTHFSSTYLSKLIFRHYVLCIAAVLFLTCLDMYAQFTNVVDFEYFDFPNIFSCAPETLQWFGNLSPLVAVKLSRLQPRGMATFCYFRNQFAMKHSDDLYFLSLPAVVFLYARQCR